MPSVTSSADLPTQGQDDAPPVVSQDVDEYDPKAAAVPARQERRYNHIVGGDWGSAALTVPNFGLHRQAPDDLKAKLVCAIEVRVEGKELGAARNGSVARARAHRQPHTHTHKKPTESMPKHDFFSPKAISNRIKAKGLQKLRWYCQMCEKQCRDENGFKAR